MTVKTNAERQREFRARKAVQQTPEVRGIFARIENHAKVKEAAAKIERAKKPRNVAAVCG